MEEKGFKDRPKAPSAFVARFNAILEASKSKITELIEWLDIRDEEMRVKTPNKKWLNTSDIPYEDVDSTAEYASSFSTEEKSVIILLYYTGADLFHSGNNLREGKDEREIDLYKLIYSNKPSMEVVSFLDLLGFTYTKKYISEVLKELQDTKS